MPENIHEILAQFFSTVSPRAARQECIFTTLSDLDGTRGRLQALGSFCLPLGSKNYTGDYFVLDATAYVLLDYAVDVDNGAKPSARKILTMPCHSFLKNGFLQLQARVLVTLPCPGMEVVLVADPVHPSRASLQDIYTGQPAYRLLLILNSHSPLEGNISGEITMARENWPEITRALLALQEQKKLQARHAHPSTPPAPRVL